MMESRSSYASHFVDGRGCFQEWSVVRHHCLNLHLERIGSLGPYHCLLGCYAVFEDQLLVGCYSVDRECVGIVSQGCEHCFLILYSPFKHVF